MQFCNSIDGLEFVKFLNTILQLDNENIGLGFIYRMQAPPINSWSWHTREHLVHDGHVEFANLFISQKKNFLQIPVWA